MQTHREYNRFRNIIRPARCRKVTIYLLPFNSVLERRLRRVTPLRPSKVTTLNRNKKRENVSCLHVVDRSNATRKLAREREPIWLFGERNRDATTPGRSSNAVGKRNMYTQREKKREREGEIRAEKIGGRSVKESERRRPRENERGGEKERGRA